MDRVWFIYLVTNLINGEQYVGQTCKENPFERWARHLDVEHCGLSVLQKALVKYKAENFHFEVIDQVYDPYAADQLEMVYIQIYETEYPNGYNFTSGGCGTKALSQLRDPEDENEDNLAEIDVKKELYGDRLHYEFGADRAEAGPRRLEITWLYSDTELQKLLLRAFPRLSHDEKQRKRAGRWARVFYLYYRLKMSSGAVAIELGLSSKKVNKLLSSMRDVASGYRAGTCLSRTRGLRA